MYTLCSNSIFNSVLETNNSGSSSHLSSCQRSLVACTLFSSLTNYLENDFTLGLHLYKYTIHSNEDILTDFPNVVLTSFDMNHCISSLFCSIGFLY